jgi:menaquinone-dependent protoporphyrinogen IX oxidase
MHSVIVFDSDYGNTREIAKAIATDLRTVGPVDLANVRTPAAATLPTDVDLLVVDGPTQMHRVNPPRQG